MSDPTGGWAKATASISDAAKEAIGTGREAGRFLSPILRPLVEAASESLEVWKARRQARLAERWVAIMRDRGQETTIRPIPPAFLVPLIEYASLETDDDLQDIWATMLANAADACSDAERRTAFLGILREMTRFDVLNLAKLAESDHSAPGARIATGELPDAAPIYLDGVRFLQPGEAILISLANIARLGCILPVLTYGGPTYDRVEITGLGRAFVKACSDSKRQ